MTTYAADSKIEYLEFYREVKIEDRLRKNYEVLLLFDGSEYFCIPSKESHWKNPNFKNDVLAVMNYGRHPDEVYTLDYIRMENYLLLAIFNEKPVWLNAKNFFNQIATLL